MKKLFTILATCASSFLFAQTIPNASFETWVAGKPTSWATAGATQGTTSVAPNAGSSYLKLTASSATAGIAFTQFAVNKRPDKLTGLLQFMAQGADTGIILLQLTKFNNTTQKSDLIGLGLLSVSAMAMNWTSFSSTIQYDPSSSDMPDSCTIIMETGFNTNHAGSYLYADLLALSGNSSVGELNAISSYNVYPNPAKDKLNIECNLKQNTLVQVEVLDIQGKQIKAQDFTMNKGENQVSLDLSDVQKGIYFVRMTSDGESLSQKLVVE